MNKKRILLTCKEIEIWINSNLRKIEDLEEYPIVKINPNPLPEPDEDGCNWTRSDYVSAGGIPVEYFGPHLAKIEREAREKFNLKT